MPVQTGFIMNADKSGDNTFIQVKRVDSLAIYQRSRMNGMVVGYEVIKIKVIPAGTVFAKGSVPTEKDYESYPGGQSCGKSLWFCVSLEQAEKKLQFLLDKSNNVTAAEDIEDTVEVVTVKSPKTVSVKKIHVLPNGIFTRTDFAVLNGLKPANSESYGALMKVIKAGLVKEIRKESIDGGRPKSFYTKI